MSKPRTEVPLIGLMVLGILAAATLGVYLMWQYEPEKPASSEFKRLDLTTELEFQDLEGEGVHISDFEGRPVLLNVWATWCAPCVEELPSLDRLQRDFPDLKVIPVSLDQSPGDKLPEFWARHRLKHLEIYADPSMKLMAKLDIEGLPFSMLIDREGNELVSVIGPRNWDDSESRAMINRLVNRGGSPAPDRPPPLTVRGPLLSAR
jgi:thiol-disulfide isomerase/thioredoxin